MPARWPLWIACGAILAVAVATPVVWKYFPEYLPSHLIQAVAIAVAYTYFRRYRLLERYLRWQQRALLVLAFVVPLQNVFFWRIARKALLDAHVALEIFRPEIALLLAVVASALFQWRRFSSPLLLAASFVIGLAGWLIATAHSAFPGISAGNGLFEFLIPYLVLFAFVVHRPDREFMVHAIVLFVTGFVLTALSQSTAILGLLWLEGRAFLPTTSMEFLGTKMNLLLMDRAGKNGYGNPDNFISAWVLVVPLLAALSYRAGLKTIGAIALAFVFYAGLLVYSRSGLLLASAGLVAIAALYLLVQRSRNMVPATILAAIMLIHAQSGAFAYLTEGLRGFFSQIVASAVGSENVENDPLRIGTWEPGHGRSGDLRWEAWRRGIEITRQHPITGIGFGVYPRADPVLTSPHSLLLLRFAEGGILSGMSLLLLAAYVPLRLWRMWQGKESDVLALGCGVAAITFLLKAMIFGGSFALAGTGLIVWGFGLFLSLVLLTPDRIGIRADRIRASGVR